MTIKQLNDHRATGFTLLCELEGISAALVGLHNELDTDSGLGSTMSQEKLLSYVYGIQLQVDRIHDDFSDLLDTFTDEIRNFLKGDNTHDTADTDD